MVVKHTKARALIGQRLIESRAINHFHVLTTAINDALRNVEHCGVGLNGATIATTTNSDVLKWVSASELNHAGT